MKQIEPIEGLAKAMNKKLTQGMAEHNKAMTAAKREEEKYVIVGFVPSSYFCHLITPFLCCIWQN